MAKPARVVVWGFVAARLILGCASALWCWYWATGVRTWSWGISTRTILAPLFVAVVIFGPWTLLAFLLLECFAGLVLRGRQGVVRYVEARLRRAVLSMTAVVLLGAVGAEVFARLQEHSFRRRTRDLPTSHPAVFEDRWWPFESSYICYDPARGQWGGGD